jgi:hypothetical protein
MATEARPSRAAYQQVWKAKQSVLRGQLPGTYVRPPAWLQRRVIELHDSGVSYRSLGRAAGGLSHHQVAAVARGDRLQWRSVYRVERAVGGR